MEKLSRLFQLREKLGLRDQGVLDSWVVEGIFLQNIRFLVKIFSTYSVNTVVDPFQGICDIAVGVTAVNAGIDGFGGGT